MIKNFVGKIDGGKLIPPNRMEFVDSLARFSGGWFEIRLTKTKPRTKKQNDALHLFCQKLAMALNDAGLDQRKVLKPSFSFPWDMLDVKNKLWKPVQLIVLKKESTTELEAQGDINKVHDVLMRELGEKHGVEYIPFPAECKSCGCLSGQGENGSNHYEGCEDINK